MYKLDIQLVRNTMFATFGPDRYKKFVVELNGRCQPKRRMFFWQEEMWNQVQELLGFRINDFATITGLFRYCHVHDQELLPELVPIVYGTRQATGAYIEVMESEFPYANEVFFGPCWQEAPTRREVYFCNACRAAKKLWQERLVP